MSKPGRINKHGAYICGPCSSGEHLGVNHGGSQYAACQCSCDGVHDHKGRLPEGAYTKHRGARS